MDSEVERLRAEVDSLRTQLQRALEEGESSYYFSKAQADSNTTVGMIPRNGMPAKSAQAMVADNHSVEFDQRLNTSSYVNVEFEKEEEDVVLMGLRVNLADQTVYPQSYKMHDLVVNMIARLWNCPEPEDFDEYGVFAGAGTVGSTEACLLSGLALKFRWRKWYAERSGKSEEEVRSVRPNLVISSSFQAA